MMNRRDLLKYFAAGTVIAPVSGAAPLAKLIETPKVTLFEASVIAEPFDLCSVVRATITLESHDGTLRTLRVDDIYRHAGDIAHQWIVPTDEHQVRIELARIDGGSPLTHYIVGRINGSGIVS